jgi:hypothetical protein
MTSSDLRLAAYLDVCCINRLYDDRSQMRIDLEATAVAAIISRLRRREWRWVGSEVVDFETEQNPDALRRTRVQ